MNAFFDRLMANVPGGIDKTAQEVPSLTLSGTGSIAIQGDRLYVSTSAITTTIDLHGQTVSQIASNLPSGITGTVLQDGMAELLLLPNQADSTTSPVTLNIAQNGLWFVVGMMARMLESRKRSKLSQVGQLNLATATSRILDWWGASVGVERVTGEPDLLYAQRIIGLKFSPNVNNVSMEKFFQTLGYVTTVTDTDYGKFDVNVILPTTPPNGFFYTTDQIQASLSLIKAAGTIATVILQGTLSDTVTIADSISATLNPASWTWGNFVWGEFNWNANTTQSIAMMMPAPTKE